MEVQLYNTLGLGLFSQQDDDPCDHERLKQETKQNMPGQFLKPFFKHKGSGIMYSVYCEITNSTVIVKDVSEIYKKNHQKSNRNNTREFQKCKM